MKNLRTKQWLLKAGKIVLLACLLSGVSNFVARYWFSELGVSGWFVICGICLLITMFLDTVYQKTKRVPSNKNNIVNIADHRKRKK